MWYSATQGLLGNETNYAWFYYEEFQLTKGGFRLILKF